MWQHLNLIIRIYFQAEFETYYSASRPTKCPNIPKCSNISRFNPLVEKG